MKGRKEMIKKIKRGDIFLADMNSSIGSEQKGIRPVLIIQNNKGNKYSPTTIVACLSSKIYTKAQLPTPHILPDNIGLKYKSMVLCEQIKVIDKDRLIKKITTIDKVNMRAINQKINISLNLKSKKRRKRIKP